MPVEVGYVIDILSINPSPRANTQHSATGLYFRYHILVILVRLIFLCS